MSSMEYKKLLGGTKLIVNGIFVGWVLSMPNGLYGLELSKDNFYIFNKESSKTIKKEISKSE
jgi:hypothetical protein